MHFKYLWNFHNLFYIEFFMIPFININISKISVVFSFWKEKHERSLLYYRNILNI